MRLQRKEAGHKMFIILRDALIRPEASVPFGFGEKRPGIEADRRPSRNLGST